MIWMLVLLALGLPLLFFIRRHSNLSLLRTVTQLNRGTHSERALVMSLLKSGRSPRAIFHDLYVKKSNGEFSQTDLVLATSVGIIVFEVKDYSGWLFGNGSHSQWTQVLAYGKTKYKFYNPIKQNQAHIKNLKAKLSHSAQIPYFSIIVFYGDCELKEINYVPKDTYIIKAHRVLEVINHIENSNPAAQYKNKRQIIDVLEEAVRLGNDHKIQERHSNQIRNMLGKHMIYD